MASQKEPEAEVAALKAELARCRTRLAELTASEEKYRHFFEKSPIMIYVTDRDGTFLNINRAGARLMGFRASHEVIGRKSQAYFFVDPVDLGTYIQNLKTHGTIREFETRMRRRDGSTITVQLTAALRRTLTGKIRGFEGFVLDITARKQAQQNLRESELKHRTILDNSLSAIYMFQDGGCFTYVNRQMVKMMGYDSADEIVGRPFWEVIAPEDRAYVKQRGLQREMGDVSPNRYEFRLLKKDGSVIWVDMQAVHAVHQGGPAVIGNFIDVTSIKQAQNEIKLLSRKLIEDIEDERRTLAADLHDEFGQTLTLLQFDLEKLQAALPAGERSPRQRCLKVMDRIQTLADAVRHTTSRLRPDLLDHLGLVPTIEWYVNDYQNRLASLRIDFQAVGFKKRLGGDSEIVLFRIFQESLNNVAKHAAAGEVDIVLTCSHPAVFLTIRDNGRGFQQVANGMPANLPLTKGIGLLSMKERVETLGGELTISSAVGRGTIIRAELPLGNRGGA